MACIWRPLGSLIIACAAWLGFGNQPALAVDACPLKLGASVPVTRLGEPPALLVTAGVADTTWRMLFDTGASITVIEGAAALRAGIGKINGNGGHRLFPNAKLNGAGCEVSIAEAPNVPLKLDRLWISVGYVGVTNPIAPLYKNQFDGLLGADALLPYDFEYDPQAGRINIFSQEHCPGKVVYWANEYSEMRFERGDDHRVAVTVKIGGKSLRGIIDTGAGHTSMSWKAASDEFGLMETSPGISSIPSTTLTSDGRALVTSRYTFDAIEFGSLRVRNATVNILPQYSSSWLTRTFGFDDDAPQVIIGMDVLQHLHFYVANAEQKIYFTVVPPPS